MVDLRQSKSSVRSSAAVEKFADFVQSHAHPVTPRPKVAVIAPTDISFGLARMFEILNDRGPLDFAVFRVVESALAWLGAPEDLMDNLSDYAQPVAPRDEG